MIQKNMAEVNSLIHLASGYYRHAEYCIITPYDAQRAAIETAFKKNDLPWENRIFAVDSFQGASGYLHIQNCFSTPLHLTFQEMKHPSFSYPWFELLAQVF